MKFGAQFSYPITSRHRRSLLGFCKSWYYEISTHVMTASDSGVWQNGASTGIIWFWPKHTATISSNEELTRVGFVLHTSPPPYDIALRFSYRLTSWLHNATSFLAWSAIVTFSRTASLLDAVVGVAPSETLPLLLQRHNSARFVQFLRTMSRSFTMKRIILLLLAIVCFSKFMAFYIGFW